jgi:hypothetical protein
LQVTYLTGLAVGPFWGLFLACRRYNASDYLRAGKGAPNVYLKSDFDQILADEATKADSAPNA